MNERRMHLKDEHLQGMSKVGQSRSSKEEGIDKRSTRQEHPLWVMHWT